MDNQDGGDGEQDVPDAPDAPDAWRQPGVTPPVEPAVLPPSTADHPTVVPQSPPAGPQDAAVVPPAAPANAPVAPPNPATAPLNPPPAPANAPVAPPNPATAPLNPPPAPASPPVLGNAIGATPPPVPPVPPPGAATPPVLNQPALAKPVAAQAPAGQPMLGGEYGVVEPPVAPSAPSGSSKLPWIAAAIGAILLLGGGSFFALTAFGASGGADTPETAADEMFEALSNEDFISLGELIEPSERRTIVEPTLTELLPELERIGLFDDSVDAGDVDGIDLEFTDLEYRVELIPDNPDMMHVYLTGGEFASELNAADFPLGDAFREEFGSDLQDDERTVEQLGADETPLTFVQRDGRWYFSGLFTVAEIARMDAGERLPRVIESPPALGSESPEAAVEAMMTEIVELDLAGMIGRMDPEEMAALYRYSPLFLEGGQQGLDELNQMMRDENITWNLSDFDFDVDTSGDDAAVTVRGFTLDVNTPDVQVVVSYGREEISATVNADELGGRGSIDATTTRWTINAVVDGQEVNAEIVIDPDAMSISGSGQADGESVTGELALDSEGVCSSYSVTVSGETESGCLEDETGDDLDGVMGFYENVFADWPEEFPGFTMQARRTDGDWYVSPIGSLLGGYVDVLGQFDDDQINELIDSANALDGLDDDVLGDIEDAVVGGTDSIDPLEPVEDASGSDDFSFGSSELEESTAATLESGEVFSQSGEIAQGGFDWYLFELEAGDTAVITVERADSGGLDTLLTVKFVGDLDASDGPVVALNDDADSSAGLGSALDSQIELTVEESGWYQIEVGSFAGGTEGGYDFTIARN